MRVEGAGKAGTAAAVEAVSDRIRPFVEHVAEATAACLFTMVQGNLLALTLGHWLLASQTGVAAGTVTAVALAATRTERRWLVASLLGVVTAAVDYLVHPGGFGPFFLEAAVTGLGAAALSFAFQLAVAAVRRRATSTRSTDGSRIAP